MAATSRSSPSGAGSPPTDGCWCFSTPPEIDVGARADVSRHLRAFADSGRGVLIATSDLAEAVAEFADTVVAFYKGRQVAVLPREGRRKEDVLAAITRSRFEGATA